MDSPATIALSQQKSIKRRITGVLLFAVVAYSFIYLKVNPLTPFVT